MKSLMSRRFGALFLALALVLVPVAADVDEDALFGSSAEDDMFSDSSPLIEEVSQTSLALEDLLLSNEAGVLIGGSFGFSLKPEWSRNLSTGVDSWGVSSSINSQLFFDARPDTRLRIYGKFDLAYPYDTDNGFLSIKELFSDFSYKDKLFFRVGKQTINWGVGYFFSPADLLNLSEINPTDAEAQLDGPLSVKMNMPMGVDNLYGYVVIPDDQSDLDMTDLAYAVKYEKVIGGSEFGFGAYYRKDQPPSAMLTMSSGIGEVAIFGEAVVSYGSDRKFWVVGGFVPVENPDDRLYVQGTVGARFSWMDDDSDLGVSFAGQYYYNGEGYGGDGVLMPLVNMGAGRHYGAANVSVTLTDTLSTGLLWYGNLGDMSGMVSPTLSWRPSDNIGVTLAVNHNFGDTGDEFTPVDSSRRLSASLGFSLGGARF